MYIIYKYRSVKICVIFNTREAEIKRVDNYEKDNRYFNLFDFDNGAFVGICFRGR